MTKFAVLVNAYPSKEHIETYAFVHTRVKTYIKNGLDIDVLLLDDNKKSYTYENVNIISGGSIYLDNIIKINNYNKILVHFLSDKMEKLLINRNSLIWVHGYEALSWRRRLFNIRLSFPKYIISNKKQLKFFKRFIKNNPSSSYIFVSNWMKDIASADIGVEFHDFHIIHNFIDNNIYCYYKKKANQRKKILLIRSFSSNKYANDISMDIINRLSNDNYFSDIEFTIYGDGPLFEKEISKIKNLNNVYIQKKFLSPDEIHELHKKHGVFLCPTRQDAQGVSMCEAMSSGLIPLTSKNTAIPEFVRDGIDGFLCDNNDVESFVNAYKKIYDDSELFFNLSENASAYIRNICSIENTIFEEIKLIKQESKSTLQL